MKLSKGDKILIVCLSIFSLVLAILISLISNRASGKYISIKVDGKEIKKIQFSKEVVGKTYEIKTEFGRNLVEIGDESARVIEADCPDKLDVKQGKITRPGQVIVCLPNRLIIEYKAETGNNEEGEIDNINY